VERDLKTWSAGTVDADKTTERANASPAEGRGIDKRGGVAGSQTMRPVREEEM